MLDAYFEAFEDFIKTGDPDRLLGFTAADTNPAYLSVYRNGYYRTCADSLAASYPVVRSLVGEDYFRVLAHAYIEAHPPTTGTLVGYGSHFAETLRLKIDEHELDYLPDAAAIDAAWLESYFAAEVTALTAADVELMSSDGIDVSTVQVKLSPPTRLVSLKHDIVDTWIHIREQGALTSAAGVPELDCTAMLWRLDGQIHIKALDTGESAFLSMLAGAETLEAAATGAYEVDESFDLATTFAALLQNRVLQTEGNKP